MSEEEREAAIRAEVDQIHKHVQRITELRNPDTGDDTPFVQAWVLCAEWTNIECERENKGGISVTAPHGQMLSASRGLADYIADHYTSGRED